MPLQDRGRAYAALRQIPSRHSVPGFLRRRWRRSGKKLRPLDGSGKLAIPGASDHSPRQLVLISNLYLNLYR